MSVVFSRYQLIVLALLAGSCTSSQAGEAEPFVDERAAAIHFLRPVFPLLDCENIGVISKGEVDDHFHAVFYSIAQLRSFSFQLRDLDQALVGSSEKQITAIFSMMDQNADGIVSTREFRDFMYKIIDLADTGRDGQVNIADLGLEPNKIIRAHDR